MKFGKTFTNKLVSYADRYFTWDSRQMKREGTSIHFDFIGRDYDRKITVWIHRNSIGIFVAIQKDGKDIIKKILCNYTEVSNFKKMLKCLG